MSLANGVGATHLLAEFVALMASVSDERRAMLARLPLPVRLVLRTIGARQYRRYVIRVRGR